MTGRRTLWLIALLTLPATPLRAEEPAAEPSAKSARADSVSPDDESEAPERRETEAQPAEPLSSPPASVSSDAPAVPISASATTGLDAGPAVMLRCLGADGVFSFGPGSDDFVAWAFSPGPIDLTQPVGLHYRFGVVPPLGEQCRVFREPFPAGVVPPG